MQRNVEQVDTCGLLNKSTDDSCSGTISYKAEENKLIQVKEKQTKSGLLLTMEEMGKKATIVYWETKKDRIELDCGLLISRAGTGLFDNIWPRLPAAGVELAFLIRAPPAEVACGIRLAEGTEFFPQLVPLV